MKKVMLLVLGCSLMALLTGCNSKNVWDEDYDLSTEIGRELHCYAEFQRDHQAKQYGAEWVSEVSNGFSVIVEGKVKADEEEYYLVCNYSDDIDEWTINVTPTSEGIAIGNPASEYCVNQGGTFDIISNETNIYGECTLSDGVKCEDWAFYNGECSVGSEEKIGTPEFDISNEEGRIAACEERAGFYLNFNEGTFTWEDESEAGASFARNGNVHYTKRGETADRNVFCFIDMVDGSVMVEFPELSENTQLE